MIHEHFCCKLQASLVKRISSFDPSASLGVEPERGRRLDAAQDREPIEQYSMKPVLCFYKHGLVLFSRKLL
jgi:hypothetical protein